MCGGKVFLWLAMLLCIFASMHALQHEKLLYRHLLQDYEPLERPVENHTDTVLVSMAVLLQQIIDVDEKNQIVETNIWQQLEWVDHRLTWNPADFGDVADLRFPVGKIWKPDVLLYNSVDRNFDSTFPSNMIVNYTGGVSWIPPGIVRISCNIDITYFPFDDQLCHFKFGSWTYSSSKLDLQIHTRAFDISEYLKNGEWLLISTPVIRHEKIYECCPNEKYPSISFYFKIRRRTLYYGFNMIVPSLVISLMTLLGFALPVESGEKITMEITILLSVCVFFTMIANLIPSTSEAVPLIGTFFTCHMFVVSASVVFSVFVLNLYYRNQGTTEMPRMARIILLQWLPWILMMKRPGHKKLQRSKVFSMCACSKDGVSVDETGPKQSASLDDVDGYTRSPVKKFEYKTQNVSESCSTLFTNRASWISSVATTATILSSSNGTINEGKSVELRYKREKSPKMLAHRPRSGFTEPALAALLSLVKNIHTELEFMTKRTQAFDRIEATRDDWKFAAMAVDRLCLIVFSIFIVVTTCGVLFSAPHLVA